MCLSVWQSLIMSKKTDHFSLHFDGLMVSGARIAEEADFAAASTAAIERETGFKLSVLQKEPQTFLFQALRVLPVVDRTSRNMRTS